MMSTFAQLKKNLKKDFSHLERIRVALLGDTATQLLTQALRGTGYERELDIEIWEAEFNQIERQVFDHNAELYAFDPQVIILFHSSHKLLAEYNKSTPEDYAGLATKRLSLVDRLCTTIHARSKAKIVYYNYSEINDDVFGNYANKVESSFVFQLRKLNMELMQYAIRQPNFHLYDLSAVQNQLGKGNMFQASVYINTDMTLSLDALPVIAAGTTDLIGALFGSMRKCLILDLDNTVWGGIIGDDGIENIQIGSLGIGKAFTEFQYWIKKLKHRGIILAVCSKNTEAIAKEPFDRHPDMVLSMEDIAVFVANWNDKVENIRHIQAILNIGFDSLVFLDDNPFERNMVREGLPAVVVPELPEDPADYLEYLYTLHLFETTSLSGEDSERTKQYQLEARREHDKRHYENEDAFLEGLNMVSGVEPFNAFNTPRVAQLSQRSNQFNLRTIRYTEADIASIAAEPGIFSFSFTLEDRFGDNGLIAVVILQKETAETLFIDTWLMSCRVLKRGMERFTLNTLAGFAANNGFRYLKGEYRPTAKNEMVKDHFERLGFHASGDFWLLDTQAYDYKKTHINLKSNGAG